MARLALYALESETAFRRLFRIDSDVVIVAVQVGTAVLVSDRGVTELYVRVETRRVTLEAVQVTLVVPKVVVGKAVVRREHFVDGVGMTVIAGLTEVALVRVRAEVLPRLPGLSRRSLGPLVAFAAERGEG
jgi:hypothetical protein